MCLYWCIFNYTYCKNILIYIILLPRLPNPGRRVCQRHPGGSHWTTDTLPGQTRPLYPLPRLLALPPGQSPDVPGERAGRSAGKTYCQSASGSIRAVEPRVLAEERDGEGSGPVVRTPEESVSASCVCPAAGSEPPAPTPRGSLLHHWLLLSLVQEGGRDQLCRW